MIRFFRFICFLVLIAAIALGAYLYSSRTTLLAGFLSKKFHAKVHIENVKIGLNRVTIKGLTFENPKGAILPYALQARRIKIKAPLLELIKKHIHIKQVKIIDPTFFIEIHTPSGNDNNWSRMLSNNNKKKSLPAPLAILSKKEEAPLLSIDKVVLENIHIKVVSPSGKDFSIPSIPHLEIPIGAETPVTISQLGTTLFSSLMRSIGKPAFFEAIIHPTEDQKKSLQDGIDFLQKESKKAVRILQEIFTK